LLDADRASTVLDFTGGFQAMDFQADSQAMDFQADSQVVVVACILTIRI
jgi:hypothetical protein